MQFYMTLVGLDPMPEVSIEGKSKRLLKALSNPLTLFDRKLMYCGPAQLTTDLLLLVTISLCRRFFASKRTQIILTLPSDRSYFADLFAPYKNCHYRFLQTDATELENLGIRQVGL